MNRDARGSSGPGSRASRASTAPLTAGSSLPSSWRGRALCLSCSASCRGHRSWTVPSSPVSVSAWPGARASAPSGLSPPACRAHRRPGPGEPLGTGHRHRRHDPGRILQPRARGLRPPPHGAAERGGKERRPGCGPGIVAASAACRLPGRCRKRGYGETAHNNSLWEQDMLWSVPVNDRGGHWGPRFPFRPPWGLPIMMK